MNERILHKLAEAKDSVELVEEKLPETPQGFQSMERLERDGIYKNIEFAIQNILDICAIILKDEELRVPGSDDDMLKELQDSKVMEGNVIEIIKQMKGFRNHLVHRYGALDDDIAYSNINV
jgi:uncharacterized protein YutE (UPF0331/DUF86 family)